MKLKQLALALLSISILTIGSMSFAATTTSIFVDGDAIDFGNAPPYTSASNRLMVPLRFISDSLNSTVFWDAIRKEVRVSNEQLSLVLPLNSYTVYINGKAVTMDAKAETSSDRIMVPLRFVSEYLGANVIWDGATQSALIESDAYQKLDDYTLLIYLNGTDLESAVDEDTGELFGAASLDLKEMMSLGSNAGVNVLVETGGTLKWNLKDINPEKNQRFFVDKDRLRLQMEMDKANMGEPKTLENFVQWGTQNFPAKKTALILWNHGGGPIAGYGVDEWFDSDALTLPELETALKNANANFSFIGFDACLMGALETATTLEPFADYLLASQELEPQGGWDYNNVIQTVTNIPYYQTETILKNIADGYKLHSIANDVGGDITLSSIRLDAISNLNSATERLFSKMGTQLSDQEALVEISKVIAKTKAYGGNTQDQGYTNLYDLMDFVQNLPDAYNIEKSAVIKALQNAVAYKVAGPINEQSSGLSLFIPYYDLSALGNSLSIYEKLKMPAEQKTFIASLSSALVSDKESYSLANHYEVKPPTDTFNYFSLVFNDTHLDFVEDVYFSVLLLVKDGKTRYRYLGYDDFVSYDADYQYYENYDQAWTMLDGHLVATQIVNKGEDFIEYEIPVLLNNQRMMIQAVWYYDETGNGTGYYEILGAREAIDANTNMPDRKVTHLKAGDVIQPIFISYYVDEDDYREEIGNAFTLSSQFKLDLRSLENQKLLFEFVIYDFAGNLYYSSPLEYVK